MSPSAATVAVPEDDLNDGAARILDDALAIVRERRGVDFSAYRRSTMERRLVNRMISVRAESAAAYLSLLARRESEVEQLAKNLTVKVSRFYRNALVFDFLRDEIVPELRRRFEGSPLRAWSAGCAQGEEAYTLAMLLSDARDEVWATDLDDAALAAAGAGRYPADAFVEVPEPLMRGLVSPADSGDLAVADVVRQRVRFVHHDLGSGTPPSRDPYHLICCRNVLIYFTRALQADALTLLVSSLADGGVLCLGEAEWPLPEVRSLEVIDRRRKIFRRTPAGDKGR